MVRKNSYLYPDANETTIANLAIEFGTLTDANGTKTIAWNETNASKYLRFNFERNVSQPANPFDVNGSDLNISITSSYTDAATLNTATITGERNADADGTVTFVYGRVNPLSLTVYGETQPVSAQSYMEIYNTGPMTLGGAGFASSKIDKNWWINHLHIAAYGDANVTVNAPLVPAIVLPANNGPLNGMTAYAWPANTFAPRTEFESHIKTMPWLWYGINALPYQDPTVDLDCMRQPCFTVKVRQRMTNWIGGGNDKGNKSQQKSSAEETMGDDMLLPRIRR